MVVWRHTNYRRTSGAEKGKDIMSSAMTTTHAPIWLCDIDMGYDLRVSRMMPQAPDDYYLINEVGDHAIDVILLDYVEACAEEWFARAEEVAAEHGVVLVREFHHDWDQWKTLHPWAVDDILANRLVQDLWEETYERWNGADLFDACRAAVEAIVADFEKSSSLPA